MSHHRPLQSCLPTCRSLPAVAKALVARCQHRALLLWQWWTVLSLETQQDGLAAARCTRTAPAFPCMVRHAQATQRSQVVAVLFFGRVRCCLLSFLGVTPATTLTWDISALWPTAPTGVSRVVLAHTRAGRAPPAVEHALRVLQGHSRLLWPQSHAQAAVSAGSRGSLAPTARTCAPAAAQERMPPSRPHQLVVRAVQALFPLPWKPQGVTVALQASMVLR